jgi:hypothetical protein
MTLEPAYGKDYKSIKEVKEAFEADKDFLIASIGPWMDRGRLGARENLGRYVNRRQLIGIERFVMIRYARRSKEVEVEVPAKGAVP